MNYGTYGFNGLTPLDMKDIQAFKELSDINITYWEATTMMQLSSAYIIEMQNKDPYHTPPYLEKPEGEYLKQNAISGSDIAKKFGFTLPK